LTIDRHQPETIAHAFAGAADRPRRPHAPVRFRLLGIAYRPGAPAPARFRAFIVSAAFFRVYPATGKTPI